MKRCLAVLFSLLATSYVMADTPEERKAWEEYFDLKKQEEKREALAKIDVDKCIEDGGEIIEVGMRELPKCILTYKDAGKKCFDSSECEGSCISVYEDAEFGTDGYGACQEKNYDGGCFAEVYDGKIGPFRCID